MTTELERIKALEAKIAHVIEHIQRLTSENERLKGQVKDTVEVQTSRDNRDFVSQGFFNLNLRRKDIPINHMMPDDETATGFTYELIPKEPVQARYVRFKIGPQRTMTVSEVQVLDSIRYEPFDLRIALPEEKKKG